MDSSFRIANAEVFDGSGGPSFFADVLVKNGVIEDIQKPGEHSFPGGTADAEGLALAPGFIDVHSHSDTDILALPSADNKISQGVTTEIAGNCGFSEFDGIRQYAQQVNHAHPAVNIAALCGHNTLRGTVMGKAAERTATQAETLRMKEILKRELEDGACGFSSGLWYSSGIYSETEEVEEIASALKDTGKPYATHLRSEGDTLLESIAEACRIAKAGDGILQISHFKTWEKQNWHKLPAALKLIEEQKKSGLKIHADRYPYLYAGTGLRMCCPFPFANMERLQVYTLLNESEEKRQELLSLLKTNPPDCGWEKLILSGSPEKMHNTCLGKTLPEIAQMRNLSVEETCVRILAESEEPIVMTGVLCRENLEKILSLDWVMPGSDAGIQSFTESGGHPRKFGTMARFFRLASRFAPMEQVIHRMTMLPAEVFRLSGRGRIAPDMSADLVLFDRNKLNAEEDYTHPAAPALGIRAVYVNGVLSYSIGKKLTGKAGKFLAVPGRS